MNKHKKTPYSLLSNMNSVLGFVFVLFIFSTNIYAEERAKSCANEKLTFKKLYLELQVKFLNYEGRDTKLDANGNITLVAHPKDKPYEGKIFEAAVFSQYQNALKKVGKLYQTAKFSKDDKEELNKSYPELVQFLKAIDGGGDTSEYIEKSNIGKVLEQLQKASEAKFKDDASKKFAITDDDKYLLKKLLTHAQDRLCSVESYENTGKGTKLFTAPYLKKIREAPLNRLIVAIKGAKLTADSDLIVDTNTALDSAIAEHMDKLGKWMRANLACRKLISNPNFLQANVQSCNYNKFLDVLENEKLDRFQAVLHYINANERLLNRPQAKAETALDELLLESKIDSAFSNLGNRIGCTEIAGPNGSKKIFVRNLPYIDNKFDTSKITCKLNKKTLSPAECSKKIEFVSDEFGRGLEMRQKKSSGPAVTFSVTENPDCSDLDLETPPTPKPLTLTDAACAEQGKKETPLKDLILSEDKKSCVERPLKLTDAICTEQGKKETPLKDLILSEDKKSCIERPLILSDAICTEKGKKETPFKDLVLSEDKKSCVEKPVILTDSACAEKGKGETPPKDLVASADKKSCIVRTIELSDAVCDERGKKEKPSRELILNKEKTACISPKEIACTTKNNEWKKATDKERGLRYSWNSEKNTCEDLKPDPKPEASEKEEKDDTIYIDPTPKAVPQSFQPIQIPTRQMYVLPGMP